VAKHRRWDMENETAKWDTWNWSLVVPWWVSLSIAFFVLSLFLCHSLYRAHVSIYLLLVSCTESLSLLHSLYWVSFSVILCIEPMFLSIFYWFPVLKVLMENVLKVLHKALWLIGAWFLLATCGKTYSS
jgi:hypothetical protein